MTDRSAFTVLDLQTRWACTKRRVLRLIEAGQLEAIDVSERPGVGRPRWRIMASAVADFEAKRASRRAVTRAIKRGRHEEKTGLMTRYFS